LRISIKSNLIALYIAVTLISFVVNLFLALRLFELEFAHTQTDARILNLELSEKKRNDVDPLQPIECDVVNGLGNSSKQACNITIWRLLEAPEQFDGKWVRVAGKYRSGFEQSALYDIDYEMKPEFLALFMQPRSHFG
jgi:hypothetical protein